jgi:hypothetical protein
MREPRRALRSAQAPDWPGPDSSRGAGMAASLASHPLFALKCAGASAGLETRKKYKIASKKVIINVRVGVLYF